MDTTLQNLLNSFQNNRFESYEAFETYRQEILYIYKKRLNDEIATVPKEFWSSEDGLINSRIVIDYIVEDILGKNIEDIPKLLNFTFFKTHKLVGLYKQHSCSVDLIQTIYPGKFNIGEFCTCPKNLWERPERYILAKELIRYNIDKYGYSIEDLYDINWTSFFHNNNMSNMFKKLFEEDAFKTLNFAFEGEYVFKKEDMKRIRKWHEDEVCFVAINKLLSELEKDIDNILANDFKRSGYSGMVSERFKTLENLKDFYRDYVLK